ncbi:hypothetical protein [Methyloversatilis sp.]|uniref:hypothetical protein n=1 Tax=Methyloversatilis sp. TaxID=2569862 RepID=UPI0035B2E4F0
MFGVFSSSPASVLGNPAELRRVLAEIAAAQPDLAINELTGWVESVSEASNIDLAHHVNLLYQFDSSAQPHLRKLDLQYSEDPEGKDVLWRTGRDFWSILSSAYEVALARYLSDPAHATVLSGLSRLASRTVRACRQRFKWDVYHNGPVDAGLWQVAGQAYLLAHASNTETREVVNAADEMPTSVEREYLRLIALHVAAPEGLIADSVRLAEQLTGYFAARYSMSSTIERGSTHWLDANQPAPPLRLVRAPLQVDGIRFFSGIAAADASLALARRVEGGESPDSLNLIDGVPQEQLARLLRHLAVNWALDPPTRQYRRHSLGGALAVANGIKHLHHVLRGARDEAVIYRWEMSDASLGGIGATAPTASAEWVRVGSLVGMQPSGGDNWLVGVVRRYLRGRDARGTVGIETLSTTARPLEVFSERQSGEAVALDDPVTGAVVRLAINGTGYSAEYPLHASINGRHVRLDPVELIERGSNFDLARFRVSDFR